MIPLSAPLRPELLHIPDGFLSIQVALAFWAVTAVVIAIALSRTRGELGERQVPVMGVMAAFIFAAQTINFPVAGGTSGHLLGGALAAIVLGPWAGILVMTTVIAVQALVFQDGGLVAMGANIFNMGILTALIGYGLFRSVAGRRQGIQLTVAGLAAWLSVVAGALATAFQLWLSGTAALRVVFPAMLGVHAIIGIGEAMITVAALAVIMRTRPDVMREEGGSRAGLAWAAVGGVVALAVVLLSPWASMDPDGLERVAIDHGFDAAGVSAPYELAPDYTIPGLGEGALSTVVAGALGLLIVAAIAMALTRIARSGAGRADARPK